MSDLKPSEARVLAGAYKAYRNRYATNPDVRKIIARTWIEGYLQGYYNGYAATKPSRRKKESQTCKTSKDS